MSLEKINSIKENINKVIIGKEKNIDLILASMIAGGHVLLEDVPGTGKTVMSKALAKSVSGVFSRIQFTPDLLPSDVTGLNFYNQKEGEFVFKEGPVFCNILLADEINRATPRTQSSLLECMEEKQVTIDGETRSLSKAFFVIATQNPIETAGTFPLPEAQLDRFLMQIEMGLPNREEELRIMNRFMKNSPLVDLDYVATIDDIINMQRDSREVYIHEELLEYIVKIVELTRREDNAVMGVSPRGTLSMLNAVRAYALVQGRDYVVPEDIKTLAVPVFAHRIVLQRGSFGGNSAKKVIEKILSEVEVPTEEWSR